MATLKEHGILMSAPMVRAILAGTKTQTRRGVLGATGAFWDHAAWRPVLSPDGSGIVEWATDGGTAPGPQPKAPHGPVGRRLWVRETWRTEELQSGQDGVRFAADDVFAPIDNTEGAAEDWVIAHNNGARAAKWKPSIHMPRWASRITLEVTRVRVERVGDISEEDARAEGVDWAAPYYTAAELRRRLDEDDREDPREVGYSSGSFARQNYVKLWDEINGAGSFAASPWVWVYDFRRVG